MRRIAVVLVLLGGVSLLAAPAFASCTVPVNFSHAASWFEISDAARVSAYAYHLASPSTPDFVLERCAGQVDELRLGLGRAGQDTCQ